MLQSLFKFFDFFLCSPHVFVPPALSHHIPSLHICRSLPSVFGYYYTHFSSFPTLGLLYLCVLKCPFPLPSLFPEPYPNPSIHSLSCGNALPPPPPLHQSPTHSRVLSLCRSWLDYYYSYKWISVEPIQRFKLIFKVEFLKLLSSKRAIMYSSQVGFFGRV